MDERTINTSNKVHYLEYMQPLQLQITGLDLNQYKPISFQFLFIMVRCSSFTQHLDKSRTYIPTPTPFMYA